MIDVVLLGGFHDGATLMIDEQVLSMDLSIPNLGSGWAHADTAYPEDRYRWAGERDDNDRPVFHLVPLEPV